MIDSSFYKKLKEVEYISFKEIIESLGGRMINETKFELPCLNEKTPSCFIYYKNGKEYFKCFGRNIGGYKVDLVALIENCSIKEAIEKILGNKAINKHGDLENQIYHKKIIENEKLKEVQTLKNMKAIINNSIPVLKSKDGIEYFKRRGLIQVVRSLNIKGIKILFNGYKDFKSIIYVIKGKNVCCIQKDIYKKENSKRYVHNYAPKGMEIAYLINNSKDKLMITEGMEDGLSSLSYGINSIVLNSANNVNRLIERINNNKEYFKNKKVYLALDNDKAGRMYSFQLEQCLKSNDISFKDIIDILVKENVKDLNELLIKDIKNR